MNYSIFNIIAPHHCCGCDKIGAILCDSCKDDIIVTHFERCICCGKSRAAMNGVCFECHPPYNGGWVVDEYSGAVKKMIHEYKFSADRSASETMVLLFTEVVPVLPSNAVCVPLPTIAAHVRERGFDHMKLLGQKFAMQRSIQCDTGILIRRHSLVQRGKNAETRKNQAAQAFMTTKKLSGDVPYILLDDVITTGNSVWYAAKALRRAGARKIWVAVLARTI